MTEEFRHSDRGTDARAWDAVRAGLATVHPLAAGDHVVVVAAHPDDETLGAGGLLAAADAAGATVTVVVATDGDASHPTSPTHDTHDLAAIRRREVYAALAELAPHAQVHLLGLPDSFLDRNVDALRAGLAPLLEHSTHVVTTWSGDRHPDHEACAHVVAALLREQGGRPVEHWQYPIWAWHWGRPDDASIPRESLRRLPLDDAARAAKQRALAVYRSQTAALSDQPGDEAVLSARMLAHFDADHEVFAVSRTGRRVADIDYFDGLYRSSDDPWGLDERFYEQRKRAAVVAALTRPRFERAFEPGCATGALTAELARRCREVVAWDVAQAAVGATRSRLAQATNVHVDLGRIPEQWPDGEFDLVLVSEVGYYCADLDALARRVDASLRDDGLLVACHWRRPASMHAHTAGAVHAALSAGRRMIVNHVEDDFLLQAWSRTGESVAVAEGIVDAVDSDPVGAPPGGAA